MPEILIPILLVTISSAVFGRALIVLIGTKTVKLPEYTSTLLPRLSVKICHFGKIVLPNPKSLDLAIILSSKPGVGAVSGFA
jgi:hypothetical protein